uniref:Dolichyl-diphosphooligosaccharide--protein glycosyltransferase subunit 2 n=1 Tax=Aceria tosichella TaxID=561515 RepID=A0A6G1S6S1_9ACAR
MMNRKYLIAVTLFISIGMIGCLIGGTDGLKPEIQHKFREPEKRPPVVVTTFFTLLVAAPVLILFAFWSKSVSLKFESLTLSRIIFHTLFLMVLACYTKFWLGTNMFDTMRYTGPLICAMFYFYK